MIEHESGSNTKRPSNLLSHLTLKREKRMDEAKVGYGASTCHDADYDLEISEEYYRTMFKNHPRRYSYERDSLKEITFLQELCP